MALKHCWYYHIKMIIIFSYPNIKFHFKITLLGEFPGCPVVRTCTFTAEAQVQSLVGELRSSKLFGVAKAI